eukprot:758480-Hanusia_phi.AAC.7
MMMILSKSANTPTSIGEIDGDLDFLMQVTRTSGFCCLGVISVQQELDRDGDGQITFDEMKGGLRRWLKDLEKEKGGLQGSIESTPLLVAGGEDPAAEESDDEDEGGEELTASQVGDEKACAWQRLTTSKIYMNSAKLMLGGTFLVALFSDPMVDAVSSVR